MVQARSVLLRVLQVMVGRSPANAHCCPEIHRTLRHQGPQQRAGAETGRSLSQRTSPRSTASKRNSRRTPGERGIQSDLASRKGARPLRSGRTPRQANARQTEPTLRCPGHHHREAGVHSAPGAHSCCTLSPNYLSVPGLAETVLSAHSGRLVQPFPNWVGTSSGMHSCWSHSLG
jgi:hypothetical protein